MIDHKWRLLDTGVHDACCNMALEKVLLTSCAEGIVPNTLHFLEFSPCVLLGYSQSLEDEINESYCRKNGIAINRRISGGGSIYMDGGALGWEIIAKKNTPGIPGNQSDMYCVLCGGVIKALSKFGIDSCFRPINDVEVKGRKISGAGGTELEDAIIFHGTVLVDLNADIMVEALKLPAGKNKYREISDFRMRTICMRELLGFVPPMEEVKDHLAQAFSDILELEFEKSGLSTEETKMLDTELPLFSSGEWIYGKQP